MSEFTQTILVSNEALIEESESLPQRSSPFQFECTAGDDIFSAGNMQRTTIEFAQTSTLVVAFES